MRLLVETHVHGALVEQLRRHGIDAVALQDWQTGRYRNAGDEAVLVAAATDGRVIVTFDLKTFPPNDVGRLLRSLLSLHARTSDQVRADRVVYLLPADT